MAKAGSKEEWSAIVAAVWLAMAGCIGMVDVESYQITVDYAEDFDQLVARGHYASVGEVTAEDFSLGGGKGYEELNVALFHLMRPARVEEVLGQLGAEEYAPAGVIHLLELGAEYPHIPRCDLILEVRTLWLVDGQINALAIFSGAGGRNLDRFPLLDQDGNRIPAGACILVLPDNPVGTL